MQWKRRVVHSNVYSKLLLLSVTVGATHFRGQARNTCKKNDVCNERSRDELVRICYPRRQVPCVGELGEFSFRVHSKLSVLSATLQLVLLVYVQKPETLGRKL